jgi:hypothetical protein
MAQGGSLEQKEVYRPAQAVKWDQEREHIARAEEPPQPDRRGAVIVRSHSRRRLDEVSVYRPQSMPGRLVVMCSHIATDAQIIDACMGLLTDDEMSLVFEHLRIEPDV